MMPSKSVIDAAMPVEAGSTIFRLELTGRIYAPSAPFLETRLRQAVERGACAIILDCTSLEALDSSALSAIIEGFKALKSKCDGKVIFAAPSEAITRILQLTRMDRFLSIAQDVAGAVATARAAT